jgi:hypothetical protein
MTKAQVKLRHRMIAIWRNRDWEVSVGKDLDLCCYVFRQLNKKGFGRLSSNQLKGMINSEIHEMQRARELDVFSHNGHCYWRMNDELLNELITFKDKKEKTRQQSSISTPTRRRHRTSAALAR